MNGGTFNKPGNDIGGANVWGFDQLSEEMRRIEKENAERDQKINIATRELRDNPPEQREMTEDEVDGVMKEVFGDRYQPKQEAPTQEQLDAVWHEVFDEKLEKPKSEDGETGEADEPNGSDATESIEANEKSNGNAKESEGHPSEDVKKRGRLGFMAAARSWNEGRLTRQLSESKKQVESTKKEKKEVDDALKRNYATKNESRSNRWANSEDRQDLVDDIADLKAEIGELRTGFFSRLSSGLEQLGAFMRGDYDAMDRARYDWRSKAQFKENLKEDYSGLVKQRNEKERAIRENNRDIRDASLDAFSNRIQQSSLQAQLEASEKKVQRLERALRRSQERTKLDNNRMELRDRIKEMNIHTPGEYRKELARQRDNAKGLHSRGYINDEVYQQTIEEIAKDQEELDNLFPTVGDRIRNLFRHIGGRNEYQGKHFREAVESMTEGNSDDAEQTPQISSTPTIESISEEKKRSQLLQNVPEINLDETEAASNGNTEEKLPEAA